jgi:hypothetical protein
MQCGTISKSIRIWMLPSSGIQRSVVRMCTCVSKDIYLHLQGKNYLNENPACNRWLGRILKMGMICSSETSIHIRTTRRYVPVRTKSLLHRKASIPRRGAYGQMEARAGENSCFWFRAANCGSAETNVCWVLSQHGADWYSLVPLSYLGQDKLQQASLHLTLVLAEHWPGSCNCSSAETLNWPHSVSVLAEH